MKFVMILVSSVLFLISCNSSSGDSSNDDSGNTSAGSAVTYATYEMIESCATGVKKITAASEAELQKLFCATLIDNAANGNCAANQREAAFKYLNCEGVWPHARKAGYSIESTQSYSFRVNSCNTGFHYISSSNSTAGQKAYCKALLDDERNQNCGREKRLEQFNESGCKI